MVCWRVGSVYRVCVYVRRLLFTPALEPDPSPACAWCTRVQLWVLLCPIALLAVAVSSRFLSQTLAMAAVAWAVLPHHLVHVVGCNDCRHGCNANGCEQAWFLL